jgi:hypothetical protein
MTRRRWVAAGLVAAVLAGGTTATVVLLTSGSEPPDPACRAGAGPAALLLSTEQAQNAATIAAVGDRLGLPERAVTIALATALRESKLFNLPFGDRDSLGLFQQRPSQGWGTPAQLVDPDYAAAAFYDRLVVVPRWRRLPLAVAAQEVQRSADGSVYALFEETGHALARVLTGSVPAGLSCVFDAAIARRPGALREAAARELGTADGTGESATAQWARAHWLVSHAYAYGIAEVSVRGQRWTNESGEWRPDADAGPPRYVLVRP